MASGLAIQVQQVERVEHYLMTWMGTPMLERLERWTALHVQRHDFAVHDRLVGIQPLARRRDSPVHPGEILVLPRTDLNATVVLAGAEAAATWRLETWNSGSPRGAV
jgi:hypothetical protein